MSGMICMRCGAPVEPIPYPGSGWLHRSAADGVFCDWLTGRRDDDDPVVSGMLRDWWQ